MRVFLSSDHHFGHDNIIDLCNRPFSDVNHMNAEMMRRWYSVVSQDDLVIYLGDLFMGRLHKSLNIVKTLPGHKILVQGNHDLCFRKPRKRSLYHRVGFKMICSELSCEIDGIPIKMCHFPYTGDHTEEDRFVDDRPVDEGGVLFCGHRHEAWRVQDKMINVGVDVWSFTPVRLEALMEIAREIA